MPRKQVTRILYARAALIGGLQQVAGLSRDVRKTGHEDSLKCVNIQPAEHDHCDDYGTQQICRCAFPGLLGTQLSGKRHASKRAAHKVGHRVAYPNQHQCKQQKLRAKYAHSVNPHHCAQRQSDEHKARRADPNVSECVN